MRYTDNRGKRVQISLEKAKEIVDPVWKEYIEREGQCCNEEHCGFLCTRSIGHEGEHIAIYGPTPKALCAIWNNKEG